MAPSGKSLHDEIVVFLRSCPDGASSETLAQKFLRLTNPSTALSAVAVKSILAADKRVTQDNSGFWHAVKVASSAHKLLEQPLAAVNILCAPDTQRILHLSLCTISDTPECLCSGWISAPEQLPHDEQEMLTSALDPAFDEEGSVGILGKIAKTLDSSVGIFLSSAHYLRLKTLSGAHGILLTDDTISVRELMSAAQITAPRPLTLQACELALFSQASPPATARRQGEIFALCAKELLELAQKQGIETREALDALLNRNNRVQFQDAAFTAQSIETLPQLPGVYGFKDRAGSFIYIGKAKSLRKRLQGYLRETDESPEKLLRLRKDAHELVTYQCGSELESLIYEYRLIRKYSPVLNKKIDILERKGTIHQIEDCIVLLPHAEQGKAMSFWFRKGQKILLKPFCPDTIESGIGVEEVESFFFCDSLPAEQSDFPELEIALRWVKAHQDSLTVVPVVQYASPQEVILAIGSYWLDTQRA